VGTPFSARKRHFDFGPCLSLLTAVFKLPEREVTRIHPIPREPAVVPPWSRRSSFVADSPLEGDGFELPVPRAMQARLKAKIAGFGRMRRRLSGAAGSVRDEGSVPRFRFAP
jgi:hypothetical protein